MCHLFPRTPQGFPYITQVVVSERLSVTTINETTPLPLQVPLYNLYSAVFFFIAHDGYFVFNSCLYILP